MAKTLVEIRGVDPLLFRDGRPFTAAAGGLTASSLPLPLPTTVAAFVRTQIGNAQGRQWGTHDDCQWVHGIPVHGPLLVHDGQVVLPAPLDALLNVPEGAPKDDTPTVYRLKPNEEAADFCDMPDGMLPLVSNEHPDGKPPTGYVYWPLCDLLGWLEGIAPTNLPKIAGLPIEERIGIEMDPKHGKAQEGQLYAARLRAFGERVKQGEHHCYSLVARVGLPDGMTIASAGTLGGERRLTAVTTLPDTPECLWPRCPQTLKSKLANVRRGPGVRMVLATSAIFDGGWRPGWLEKAGSGAEHLPAGIANVKLEMVGAAVGRRVPVSGWSVRENQSREIRWMVPAGSTYFFKVTSGDPKALFEKAWMKPVSDNEQDRRDGLGLALWGIW